jgi:EAL domain-containing protein (putative c-di-GMP-specific phosphodiesterase class I)
MPNSQRTAGGTDDLRFDARTTAVVLSLLDMARTRTATELCWVSWCLADEHRVEWVVGDGGPVGVISGAASPLELDVVADAATAPGWSPFARLLAAPLRDGSGTTVGLLCAASRVAATTVESDLRDARLVEQLAVALGELLLDQAPGANRFRETRARIAKVLSGDLITTVFQPIVELATGRLVGAEALARFPSEPIRPDLWFAEADSVGMGLALELAAARSAVRHIDELPEGMHLGVNASPALVRSQEFLELVAHLPPGRLVVELTEHTEVLDYDELRTHLHELRLLGARIAIDDVGAGFSSLAHVLQVDPEYVKLDISITRGIDRDPARRSAARGLLGLARDIGALAIAEGVETQGELDTLQQLGFDAVQGFLLARPGPLPLPEDYPRPSPRRLGASNPVGSEEDALAFLARAWFNSNDLESIARPLLDAVLDRTGLQLSFLTSVDLDLGTSEVRFSQGTAALSLSEGASLAWDETLCRRCRDKGILWTADVPTDLPGSDIAEAFAIQTFLSVPILANDGALIGTVCAASTEERYLGEATINEISLMAQLVGDRLVRTRPTPTSGT